MLDIIIPHYLEDWEICRKQFWMLDLQRCADWSRITVTVVNDGGHRLPEDRLAELHFPVHQLDIPHGGVSAARNAGLENANGTWVMFCDCDDAFANLYALRDIQNVLTPDAEERFDLMWGACCEEDNIDGTERLTVMPRNKVFVFCHGKVYRRQFLMEQGIRFDPALRFNEDSCFNATCIARIHYTRIGEIKTHAPIYTWIRRHDSVTTGRNAEDDGAYGQFRRNLTVTEENRLHRARENYCGMVTRTAYDAYYMLAGRRVSRDMKRRIFSEFVPWMREHIEDYGEVEPEILNKIREVSRLELLEAGEIIPDSHETVREWVHKITEVSV